MKRASWLGKTELQVRVGIHVLRARVGKYSME